MKEAAGSKHSGRGKRRPLRGQAIVQAAQTVLAQWSALPPDTHPINISTLAKMLGVTRQAIYNNGLSKSVAEHKAIQQQKFSPRAKAAVLRKTWEERIASLEQEVESLKRIRDGWIERWATVEYNARMLGIDADKIFATIPPPHRKS